MTYKATIKVMGKTYFSSGETKEDALGHLEVSSNLARGPSILTLERDGKVEERILPPLLSQRLFSLSPSVRAVNIKNVSMRFSL